ncbi:MAG TPA: CHAT domain-containing protein [Candidatus Krumholzibacteria bacterium]|nr:CHAT domain-containing protein [Candidatus Krumholzibacteria bacterium]HPD70674.1 CHAT domain-containing protein [Candidatus Krumholzibacteria bacterium]HRY39626.1 CHAT domain-containing protein [Candidatus Krumholzibacteria bacterium]
MSRRAAVLSFVLVAGLVLSVWFRLRPQDPLASLVPGLDREIARALRDDDDAGLVRLATDCGSWTAIRIYEHLRDALADPDGRDAPRRRAAILPHLERWAGALAAAHELPEYVIDADYWRGLGPAATADLVEHWRGLQGGFGDGSLPADSVKVLLLDHHAAFRAAGHRLGIAQTGYNLGNICLTLGDLAEARRWFAEVLDEARQWGLTAEICDALNSLALFALIEDDTAGEAYLVEALALARRSHLAGRVGRALTVAGIQARDQGRFAGTMDLMEEAVEACGQMGEAWQGLPYLVYLMRFHAGLDDWRQVAVLAPRAEVLLREAENAGADALMIQREGLRLRELRLRLRLQTGDVDAALARYPDLIESARRLPFAEVTYIHDRLVRALLAVDRSDAALAVLPAALAHAEAREQPELLNLLLAEVEANLELGRLDAARAALVRFETVATRQPGWARDLQLDAHALRAILGHREGRPDARAALSAGLAQLAASTAASDGSGLAYLELQRNRLLRRALREVVGEDPEVAYGLELLWRRLPAWLGDRTLPDAFAADPAGLAREFTRARRATLGADRVHLLFTEHRGRVVRWQVDERVLRCDTLAVSAVALQARVDSLIGEAARDPGSAGARVPPSLARQAEALAGLLLPAPWRDGRRPRELLVSGDGALAQLPFGVLDLEAGPGYSPLALTVATATVRDAGGAASRMDADTGVIVADPIVSLRLRRRHPGLTDLAATDGEVDAVNRLLPRATVLCGEAATLPNLQARWQQVAVLYFACHTVRSPESPFRTFLPLSDGAESPLQRAYLDIAEIRRADFSGCQLVVLASCASGAPYVSGRVWAPSLGDAFLDAGAGAALQTLWRVRDEDAARIPALVLSGWRLGGESPVAALAAACRTVMVDPGGRVRHPFGWAAYVVELRDI